VATSEVRLRLHHPLAHQLDLLRSPARFKLALCGRRWHKTTSGLIAVVDGHGPVGSNLLGLLDGARIWWVVPEFPTAGRAVWRSLRFIFAEAEQAGYAEIREVEHRIVFHPTTGSIEVRTADDPGSLVGVGLDGLVMDEVAKMQERAWRESLAATLIDRKGWAMFLGTPKGYNWVWRLWCEAEHDPAWARWQRPTFDNPRIEEEEIAMLRRLAGPLLAAQEVDAQFVAAGGLLFHREWFAVEEGTFGAEAQRVRYWDLAASPAGDWTVGLKLARDATGRFRVEDVARGRWTPGVRDQEVAKAARSDGYACTVGLEQEGGSGGPAQVETLTRLLAGYRVQALRPTGKKSVRAGPVASQAEQHNVSLTGASWNFAFLDELEAFTGEQKAEQDDQVDALAGAFTLLVGGGMRTTDSVFAGGGAEMPGFGIAAPLGRRVYRGW
jgi:predicted phage terminase large subunit-like protein